jgi:hypothetical protein
VTHSPAKEAALMTQRTTWVLLVLLVIGVWGLLLRPAVTPVPVRAQNGDVTALDRAFIFTTNGVYLYAPSGNVYRFGYDLTLKDHAYPVSDLQGDVTYKVLHQ